MTDFDCVTVAYKSCEELARKSLCCDSQHEVVQDAKLQSERFKSTCLYDWVEIGRIGRARIGTINPFSTVT